MLLVIIKEFETESVITEYHAYVNDWIPTLGENLSPHPEPENENDKYAMTVTKDWLLIGNLNKEKTGQYARIVFYFLQANPMNTTNITVTGKRVNFGYRRAFQIPCKILFQGEEKIYWCFEKNSWIVHFMIICTLEILSVKY